MPHSIKLFRWIRKMYRIIGIYPVSKSKQNALTKWRKLIIFMSLMTMLTASNAFILFEAETTAERATGFSTSALVSAILVFFLILMLEVKNIIKLIRKFEDFVRKNKRLDLLRSFCCCESRFHSYFHLKQDWWTLIRRSFTVNSIGNSSSSANGPTLVSFMCPFQLVPFLYSWPAMSTTTLSIWRMNHSL